MIRLLSFSLMICLGAVFGVSLTWLVLSGSLAPGAVEVGPWRFSPRLGSVEIDPYQRASLFARGELPLAEGEGFALIATQDQTGTPLSGACRYTISGALPRARFWSLSLTDQAGVLIPNTAERHVFTSAEILRAHDGRFTITIAPSAQGGNWLPSTGAQGLVLAFRFYDTPLSAPATVLSPAQVPVITRDECR